jgi:hypothetical protein
MDRRKTGPTCRRKVTSFAIVHSFVSNTHSRHLNVVLLSKISGKQAVSLSVRNPAVEDEALNEGYLSHELGLLSRYGTALRSHSG